ncbi:MAG: hypothetical protein IPI61_15165 [Syntrophaceae bacterium]|nr:hypothetical protein [Syntrophaceae bacterium]
MLRNRGHIDAESIEEYIAHDGYLALHKAPDGHDARGVIEEVKLWACAAGAARVSSGTKWEEARKYSDLSEHVIWNGDEGDPGAFMDRSLMESDPTPSSRMMVCGYATVPARVTSTCGPSIPWQSRCCERPSTGRAGRVSWAANISGTGSTSTSTSVPARGLRLRRVDGPDVLHRGKARHAAHQAAPFHRTRPSGRPTLSTTWRPSPTSPDPPPRGRLFRSIGMEDSTGTLVFFLTGP